MPEQTWLSTLTATRISGNSPAETGKSKMDPLVLSLRGVSTSQRLVGEAMLRMSQFPEFEKVELDYTQKGSMPDADTLDFQITLKVKPIDDGKDGAILSASN